MSPEIPGEKVADFSNKLIPVTIYGHEIKFVNLFKLSLTEHLQTLFVTIYTILFWTVGFQSLTAVILFTDWTPPLLRYVFVVYLGWILLMDRETDSKEGRKCTWFRNLRIFRLYNDYFPIRLVKTADLTPDKNYLLVMYPHGIAPFSIATTFGSNCNNLDKLYPNIDFQFATLRAALMLPIIREYYLSIGGRTASEASILYFLNSEPSKGLLILPQGASEALKSRVGNECVIEKYKRKGFMRIALQTGTSVVPVFSFGENNTLEGIYPSSKWYQCFANTVNKFMRFRPVVVNGAGLFQQSFGILPRRTPVTTVVGKPIPIPKIENPSEQQIKEYLDTFFQALYDLFEEHKHKYNIAGGNAVLRFS